MFGHRCRFRHVDAPYDSNDSNTAPADSSSSRYPTSRRPKCPHCKGNHAPSNCFKTQLAEINKRLGLGESSHPTVETSSIPATDASGSVTIDGVAYACVELDQEFVPLDSVWLAAHSRPHDRGEGNPPSPGRPTITMLMDGGSTCAVVQSEKYCVNIREANIWIKTGGKGKPTLVHCTKVGDLPVEFLANGRLVQMVIECRIVPGFGVNVLPESFFLKKNFAVNKVAKTVRVLTPDNKLVLSGKAFKEQDNWLFYVTLRITARPASTESSFAAKSLTNKVAEVPSPAQVHVADVFLPDSEPNANNTVPCYLTIAPEGERERCALLPVVVEDDTCFAATRARGNLVDILQLWHERLGHRNMKDVADMLGLSLPDNMPLCTFCIAAKSKRHALTGSAGLHETVRPGHTIGWDHAGPFAEKTWGGHSYFSLKIDFHTGKILFPKWVHSTANTTSEWKELILRLTTRFGRQVCAMMVTDFAPYFRSTAMANFNSSQGIEHVPAPAYTQELNSIPERTFGTIWGMVRTNLNRANAPSGAHGECAVAMCHVLDRIVHKSGGKLSRLEKWKGHLIPGQRDHLKVWGCAAYLHCDYGKRGTIGDLPKLANRAILCMFVGYEPNGLGYRLAELPTFRIRTHVLHCTFIEDSFPCVTTLRRELGAFNGRLQGPPNYAFPAASAPLPAQRSRPPGGRIRVPSAAALERIADGPPSPPDEDVHYADCFLTTPLDIDRCLVPLPPDGARFTFDATYRSVDSPTGPHWADDSVFSTMYDDIVHASSANAHSGVPRNIPAALQGPEREAWLAALHREASQHEKNGTFGPPVSAKDLPPGCRPIPFDCITKEKRGGMKKARGIIKGFHMSAGIDYNETFAPVPCLDSIRLFLAIAAHHDWDIMQGDVATAFLCADMDAEVYAALPNWFKPNSTGYETGHTIRRLLKAVPGIPQGPRLWHMKFRGIALTELQLTQCRTEFCLYYCLKRHLYLIVWVRVDDIFLFFPKQARSQALELWKWLQKHLDLDDWADIDDCLACIIRRDRPNRTLSMSQEPALRKLLQRTNFHEVNGKDTPMVPNLKLSKKQCPSEQQAAVMTDEQRFYRSTVACMIYFCSWTRPDICYAVSKCCKFMHNPGPEHIAALHRILRYLKQTVAYGLVYRFGPNSPASEEAKSGIYGLFDASHADCPDTMRSTLAYLFFYHGCPISWNSKLHSLLTLSTNHSEFCAAAKAAREAKKFTMLATQIGFGRLAKPIDLFSDSKGTIAMTYNPVQRTASKHIDLADHYAREQQELGHITVSYLCTRDMIADLLTKPLGRIDFHRHASKLVEAITL